MREILFRGKRWDNGKWETGDLLQYQDGRTEIHSYVKGCRQANEVDNRTIGQYTGLEDVNGVKIFEGDIVSFERVNALGYTTSRIGDVRYYDKLPIFYIMATTGDAWDWCVCEKITVIGNIHDNLEPYKGVE